MELFVCKRNGQYIDNGASVRFHTYYRDINFDNQFEACKDREDVITLAKYFFLLAKECPEIYGEIDHGFLYEDAFTNRLAELARRSRPNKNMAKPSSSSMKNHPIAHTAI
jgi:hypothetical protein